MGTLRREAKLRGMTVYRLAKVTGIALGTMYYYAHNPDRIPFDRAETIRKALSMTPDEWISWFSTRQKLK